MKQAVPKTFLRNMQNMVDRTAGYHATVTITPDKQVTSIKLSTQSN